MATSREADTVVIFRPYKKGPNGRIMYARDYGLKAWPIHIPKSQLRK